MTSAEAMRSTERQQRRDGWMVLAVGVVCALHVGKLPVAIPVLQRDLGLDLLQAAFLLSLLQLAGMSLGLVVGMVADRWGARRVMLVGLSLLAAGCVLGAVSGSVRGLLVTRVIEGLGFLLAVLPAPALLRQRVTQPAALARALGWWGAYMPLGTALALLAGAPLLGFMGWQWVWWGLALLTLAVAWALARAIPAPAASEAVTGSAGTDHAAAARTAPSGADTDTDTDADSDADTDAEAYADADTRRRSPWSPVRRTLSSAGPWLVALAFFLYSGQWLAVVGFLPTIYSEAGLTGAVLGTLTALAAGVNMLGNIAAGRWLSRGGRPVGVLSAGYAAMALGAFAAFAAVGNPPLQYAGVLLFSGVGGLIPGTLFSLAVRLAPGASATSSSVGWMQQFSALGQFVGPPFVAWVALQAGGWHLTWVVTGCCSLGGIALSFRLQRAWSARQRKDGQP